MVNHNNLLVVLACSGRDILFANMLQTQLSKIPPLRKLLSRAKFVIMAGNYFPLPRT